MAARLKVIKDIPFGDPGRNQYAFRAGDYVPADVVRANGWGDYVEAPSTKKADDDKSSGDKK